MESSFAWTGWAIIYFHFNHASRISDQEISRYATHSDRPLISWEFPTLTRNHEYRTYTTEVLTGSLSSPTFSFLFYSCPQRRHLSAHQRFQPDPKFANQPNNLLSALSAFSACNKTQPLPLSFCVSLFPFFFTLFFCRPRIFTTFCSSATTASPSIKSPGTIKSRSFSFPVHPLRTRQRRRIQVFFPSSISGYLDKANRLTGHIHLHSLTLVTYHEPAVSFIPDGFSRHWRR